MPSARDGSARGVSEGGARLLGIAYADRADVLPIAEFARASGDGWRWLRVRAVCAMPSMGRCLRSRSGR